MWATPFLPRLFPVLVLALAGLPAVAAARGPCAKKPVDIARVWGPRNVEQASLVLTLCTDQPNLEALGELSVLARPHGVDRPESLGDGDDDEVAPKILRLDPRLLTRLQAIADQWPGKRIDIVSGYRPSARNGSRHRHGQALDVVVTGVSKEDVVAFAKTIPGTGVGYYPNSVLTHIDVRDQSYAWVDKSAPGEAAFYTEKGLVDPDEAQAELNRARAREADAPAVAAAPKTATSSVRSEALDRVRAALAELEAQRDLWKAPAPTPAPAPTAAAAPAPKPAETPAGAEEAALSADEVAALRADAIRTVTGLLDAGPIPAPSDTAPGASVGSPAPTASASAPTPAPVPATGGAAASSPILWDALRPAAPSPETTPAAPPPVAAGSPVDAPAADPVNWDAPWQS